MSGERLKEAGDDLPSPQETAPVPLGIDPINGTLTTYHGFSQKLIQDYEGTIIGYEAAQPLVCKRIATVALGGRS